MGQGDRNTVGEPVDTNSSNKNIGFFYDEMKQKKEKMSWVGRGLSMYDIYRWGTQQLDATNVKKKFSYRRTTNILRTVRHGMLGTRWHCTVRYGTV